MNRQIVTGIAIGVVLFAISNAVQEATINRPPPESRAPLVSDLQREMRLVQTPRAHEIETLAALLAVNDETYKQDLAANFMASSTDARWRAKMIELFGKDMVQLRRQIAASMLVIASLDDWTNFLKGSASDRLTARKCTTAFEAITLMSRKYYAAEKAHEAQALLGLTDNEIMQPKH